MPKYIKAQLSEIKPGRANEPRRSLSEEDIKERAASMKRFGLLQPVGLRPVKGQAPYKYERVFGQLRIAAAERLGWQEIDAVLAESDDLDSLLKAGHENTQRTEMTGYEEYLWLMDITSLYEKKHHKRLNKAQLAKLAEKPYNWVDNRLQLENYRPDVLDVVKRKKMVISAATLINRITDEEQRAELLDLVEHDASFVTIKTRADEMARMKAAKASARRAPDTHTQQRITTANASGSAPISRGKQVTGASVSQSVSEAVNGLKTASAQIDNAATWFRTIDEKSYEAKVVPELKKLIAKLEVFLP